MAPTSTRHPSSSGSRARSSGPSRASRRGSPSSTSGGTWRARRMPSRRRTTRPGTRPTTCGPASRTTRRRGRPAPLGRDPGGSPGPADGQRRQPARRARGLDTRPRLRRIELDLGDDLELAAPADARFRLTRTNRGLLVDGDVHATLAETCSRCLRPIQVAVEQEIDEEALQTVELTTGARIDHADEPDVARITGHHEIELEPFVREAIQLAAPIAPLCRPDCPGLCVDLWRGARQRAT